MSIDTDLALPAAALPAWQAYRRLLDTKAAHFAALEAGERDAREGVKPRLAQQAHLAALLEAHTTAVTAFKTELQALARSDPTARDALVAALGRVNEGLVPNSGFRCALNRGVLGHREHREHRGIRREG